MSMNVNEFKKKFTQELFDKASACKTLREMMSLMEKENIALDEEELDMFVSMMSERNKRPDGSHQVEWNSDCYGRFKLHSDTCDAFVKREYPSDKCWEGGVDPRIEPEEKPEVCMHCDNARTKQFYCFCTK